VTDPNTVRKDRRGCVMGPNSEDSQVVCLADVII